MGDMDPHIFAVAEEAYKQMARWVGAQSMGSDLTVVSKAVKYAIKYCKYTIEVKLWKRVWKLQIFLSAENMGSSIILLYPHVGMKSPHHGGHVHRWVL